MSDHEGMVNQVIPEAAVDAAARALWDLDRGPNDREYQDCRAGARRHLRREVTAALEAAAPHMLGEITTRVEQVNLPNGTVILTEQGGIFQHFNGYWFEPASSYRHHLDDITLPATVIHRPTP